MVELRMPNKKKPSTLKKSSANRPKQNRQQRTFPKGAAGIGKKEVVREAEESNEHKRCRDSTAL